MLAARYFPERVDAKCQEDPSLAVAHGCFWAYYPDQVEDIRADELKRRERDADEAADVLPVAKPGEHPGRD